jgi:hypothetical protein
MTDVPMPPKWKFAGCVKKSNAWLLPDGGVAQGTGAQLLDLMEDNANSLEYVVRCVEATYGKDKCPWASFHIAKEQVDRCRLFRPGMDRVIPPKEDTDETKEDTDEPEPRPATEAS